MRMILDASVLVKLIHQERDTKEAIELMEQATVKDIELISSVLIFYEVGNALWKHLRKKKVEGSKYMEQLFLLDVEYVPLSKAFAYSVMGTALKYDITYYDAVYVTLAEQHNATLVTEDKELLKKSDKATNINNALQLLEEPR